MISTFNPWAKKIIYTRLNLDVHNYAMSMMWWLMGMGDDGRWWCRMLEAAKG